MCEWTTPTVCRFQHVSAERYAKDSADALPLSELPLPRRGTAGAAGYDFVCPVEAHIAPGGTALIPTGIRAEIAPGWVLLLFPRSSLGFKHRLMLCNTVGVIDSDYFHADNEGHILVKLHNAGDHAVTLQKGNRFCQGLLLPFGLAEEEDVTGERRGGFGSTGR